MTIFFGLAEQAAEESLLAGSFGGFVLGVYGIADSGIGNAAEFVDEADRLLDIVDVVEGVEDAHHVEAVFDSLLIEALQNAVGIRHIAEEVAAAGKGRKERAAVDGL